MPASFAKKSFLFLAALLLAATAAAQTPAIAGLAAVPNLSQLTRSSGYIFSGTVVSVLRAGTPGDLSAMLITFKVEQAVRGVRAGQVITIREWAGLWDAGERYSPGERVMLFLYPPSRLGLTSPVGGSQGRFSIDRNGQIILPPTRINALWPAPITIVRPTSGTAISTKSFVQAIRLAGRE